jgi:hypothetical protein
VGSAQPLRSARRNRDRSALEIMGPCSDRGSNRQLIKQKMKAVIDKDLRKKYGKVP